MHNTEHHHTATHIAHQKLTPAAETVCLHEAANRCLTNYFKNLKGMAPAPDLFERVMGEVEKPLLEHVLKYVRGNQLRAAEILGINRNTLRKKIRQWKVDTKDCKPS